MTHMRAVAIMLVLVGAAIADELPAFDKLWNYAKPDETEKKFRELLPQAEAADNLDYELQLRTQIARTLGLQGKFEEAHAELDLVAARLSKDTPVARVRYLLERGRAWRSGGLPARGRALFLEAWDLGRNVKAPYFAVDAAHMMALVEPPEKKKSWNLRAMEYAEESKDARAMLWLGTLYNNMGWDAHEAGDYKRALELLQKCWDWHKERKTGRGELIAKWSVAKQLRLLKRVDEAYRMQQELLETYTKADEENGYLFEELGECLLALGKPDEARPWFQKAYAILGQDEWHQKNEPKRLERLKGLASGGQKPK